MAKKPIAARGKATRKGKLTKAIKTFKERRELIGSRPKKSPGALGGKTKPKPPSQLLRRRIKLAGMGGTGGLAKKAAMAAGKGSGKSLSRAGMAGMSKAVFNEAKKLKPSGRLSVDDLKRTRDMLKKRKGK